MLKTEALKKTEKIASATYLVTGFFDDKEPLKWKLRMLASKLVSASLFLKDNSRLKEEKNARDIQTVLVEMTSLLSVARSAGLISEMNHDIFQKEIEKFVASFIDPESNSHNPNSPVLSESFFSVPREISAPVEPEPVKDKTPQVHAPERLERPAILAVRDTKPPVEKEKKLKEFGTVAVKKNARQSVIINLLKRKREIMIKDVTPLIEGVSEKTIQRELLAMVEQGIIKKEGEKRWSRYSLA